MRVRTALALAIVAGAASSAMARPTISSFSLNDGGFRYNERNLIGAGAAGAIGGDMDFGLAVGASPSTTVASDYGFRNWWYYRIGATGAERALQTQTDSLAPGGLNPNQATLEYTEAIPGVTSGALKFLLQYTLTQVTANSAAVTINWQIQNTSQQAVNMSFFSYTNYDVGSFSDDAGKYTSTVSANEVRTDASSTDSANFATVGADILLNNRWQVAGNFFGLPDVDLGMIDASTTNFPDSVSPTTGDIRSGFQWDLAIAAGGQTAGRVTKGYNYSFIPAPGASALMGIGGILVQRRRRR